MSTVFAPAAGAAGRAALAVVRASGAGAGPALRALLNCAPVEGRPGREGTLAGALPPARRLTLRELRCPRTGELLDRACVAWLPGPRTYTGEDGFELYLHGGRAVLGGVLGALGAMEGLRPAEPGEFARRAFLAGRVGLTELEGLADLLAAETAAQRRHALALEGGAAARALARWRATLVRARAQLEARLDFADEVGEGEGGGWGASRAEAEAVLSEVQRASDDGGRASALVDGLGVLLAGRPNAGKSSVLNVLSDSDAAIVHEEAGTTRDVLRVPVDLGGFKCVLADTAGLRRGPGVGEVEAEGVKRVRLESQRAQVRVLVLDARAMFRPSDACVGDALEYRRGSLRSAAAELSEALAAPFTESTAATIFALNKCDMLTEQHQRSLEAAVASELLFSGESGVRGGSKVVFLSCRTGVGVEALLRELTAAAAAWFGDDAEGAGEGPSLFHRDRQRRRLGECAQRLGAALESEAGLEIAAEELRLAVDALGRVTGTVDPEEVLGAIFSEFCIGK